MATSIEFCLCSTKYWWLHVTYLSLQDQLGSKHICYFHVVMHFCCEIQVFGLLDHMTPTSLWMDQVRWQLDGPLSSIPFPLRPNIAGQELLSADNKRASFQNPEGFVFNLPMGICQRLKTVNIPTIDTYSTIKVIGT